MNAQNAVNEMMKCKHLVAFGTTANGKAQLITHGDMKQVYASLVSVLAQDEKMYNLFNEAVHSAYSNWKGRTQVGGGN